MLSSLLLSLLPLSSPAHSINVLCAIFGAGASGGLCFTVCRLYIGHPALLDITIGHQKINIEMAVRPPKVTSPIPLSPGSTAPVRVHTSQEQTGPVLHATAQLTGPVPTCLGAFVSI
ncbi:hypothetical protein DPX16_19470 [Anabarilius grahami]|uniref:Secreted protein n=1 Tax=Anabarilius grahami TaxID=495550 RepID=A0A3N0Z0Y6_ANAGA|nr:hypothetical protein DPX16_19470 [Anabarilius grahami]